MGESYSLFFEKQALMKYCRSKEKRVHAHTTAMNPKRPDKVLKSQAMMLHKSVTCGLEKKERKTLE